MPETSDTTQRSLIELAREAIARAEREMTSYNLDYAAGVVAGYDEGVARVHHDGVRDYSGALALANERIKELESQLAAISLELHITAAFEFPSRDGAEVRQQAFIVRELVQTLRYRIDDLEAEAIELKAKNATLEYRLGLTRPVESLCEQGPAAPVVGVVVTKEMVNVALNEWLTGDHREMNGTPDVIRAMLTAALRTAHTVPLVSAEPMAWNDDSYTAQGSLGVCGSRDLAAKDNPTTVTPLYAGLAEPAQRGEG